jgi:ribosome-associated protein
MTTSAEQGRRKMGAGNSAQGGPAGPLEPGLPGAELLELVLFSLDEDKAQDVVTINLVGKTTMADAMVVATGRSHRHVGAIADNLSRRLKQAGHGRMRIEGLPACDWVLIDAGDVIVHLFRPEVRAFYNLEKIWAADLSTEQRAV